MELTRLSRARLNIMEHDPSGPNLDNEQVIKNLEQQAEKLLDLMNKNMTVKRPLIIEFSGSPKAGKTRCISGLELFLKRNGFRVQVFTERASVSPIKSKGHLFFNTWVSCASLQGMLECLYSEHDVFILDRGLFDALVWNQWLSITGKITSKEANAVDQFFTMPQWADLVDLVIVMTCDPEISLKREYADQLTTKKGTIMASDTLKQLEQAVEATIQKNGTSFRRIERMDTTNTTTIGAAAQVTQQALDSMHHLLDESICVVPEKYMPDLPATGMIQDSQLIQSFLEAIQNHRQFAPRSEAENNVEFYQPIPCAIVMYEDKVLFLKRKKKGHPLHDTYAVWAGGHVTVEDDGNNILEAALRRELSEEIFIRGEFELNSTPVALVRTSEDPRASRHIGVVYRLNLKTERVALAMNQREFREARGTSMSGRLVEVKRASAYYDQMGDWSKHMVDCFWPRRDDSSESPLVELPG